MRSCCIRVQPLEHEHEHVHDCQEQPQPPRPPLFLPLNCSPAGMHAHMLTRLWPAAGTADSDRLSAVIHTMQCCSTLRIVLTFACLSCAAGGGHPHQAGAQHRHCGRPPPPQPLAGGAAGVRFKSKRTKKQCACAFGCKPCAVAAAWLAVLETGKSAAGMTAKSALCNWTIASTATPD